MGTPLDGNDKARKAAAEWRSEAKRHAANGDFAEMVDCIIAAAMLEVALVQSDAIKQIPSSDNP